MLAVVVDDHDMGVTHIIRGDDHLTNAARQTQIYQALGWDIPVDGAYPAHPWAGRLEAVEAAWRARRRRLSRDGLSAGRSAQLSGAARLEPRRQGVLLHRRADRRVRSRRRSAARRRASTTPSSRTSTGTTCARRATTSCSRRSSTPCPTCRAARRSRPNSTSISALSFAAAIPGLKERAKTLVELLDGAGFLFAARPLAMDAKAEEILARAGRLHLKNLLPRLTALTSGRRQARRLSCAPTPKRKAQSSASSPSRCARRSTGRSTSPGIFDVLAVLGREESLGRIADQAARSAGRLARYRLQIKTVRLIRLKDERAPSTPTCR